MNDLPPETDFIVIGAGVAGLRAAIELAAAGRVLVLAKKEGSHTSGSSVTADLPSDEDEVILHLQDTLVAGEGLCLPQAVRILVEQGVERIEELMEWAKRLDKNGTKLTFDSEASYSHSHVLRSSGESAGSEILRTLRGKARSCKNVSMAEFEFSTQILTHDQRVTGVSLIADQGPPEQVKCSAVMLATGGLGQLYRNTTNPESATGDGVAMAFRT